MLLGMPGGGGAAGLLFVPHLKKPEGALEATPASTSGSWLAALLLRTQVPGLLIITTGADWLLVISTIAELPHDCAACAWQPYGQPAGVVNAGATLPTLASSGLAILAGLTQGDWNAATHMAIHQPGCALPGRWAGRLSRI